jgi:hypothetical protein
MPSLIREHALRQTLLYAIGEAVILIEEKSQVNANNLLRNGFPLQLDFPLYTELR